LVDHAGLSIKVYAASFAVSAAADSPA